MCPRGGDPVPTFNWVFIYQQIANINTAKSLQKAESNLLADEKGPTGTNQLSYTFIIG